MGVFKWIGGAVGFAWGSALGGFLGFGIGALLDQALEGADAKAAQGEAGGGAYDTAAAVSTAIRARSATPFSSPS